MTEPLAVSVREAARMIGVSRSSLYTIIGEGKIRAIKISGHTLILVAELLRFLLSCPTMNAKEGAK
jgi:excisionase family DNA binding protein